MILNSFLDTVPLGAVRKVAWSTEDDTILSGSLLLPPIYRPGQRLPLIVWVYGGYMGSEFANEFGFSGRPVNNAQMWASRGYAVLYPDIPQRLGQPLKDIARAVLPALDQLVSQGIADPDRLALGGHSYGSYSALALLTRTTRFRAAFISGVVAPDLTSAYLRMRAGGQSSEAWAETGQGLLGGPPWQYAARYLANSPIYHFDKIKTPVLIGQGGKDVVTPPSGADAAFVALRRLGVPVEYRLYPSERHVFENTQILSDWWDRRLSFVAEHLDIALDQEGRVIMERGRAKPRRDPANTTQGP